LAPPLGVAPAGAFKRSLYAGHNVSEAEQQPRPSGGRGGTGPIGWSFAGEGLLSGSVELTRMS
jgi:hypothetical protein